MDEDEVKLPESKQSARIHKRSSVSTSSRVYEANCIFSSNAKNLKGQRTRETRAKCKEMRVEVVIREAAIYEGDSRMLGLLSQELVAAEGHYHHSCYRAYTRVKKGKETKSIEIMPESDTNQESIDALMYDTALQ